MTTHERNTAMTNSDSTIEIVLTENGYTYTTKEQDNV